MSARTEVVRVRRWLGAVLLLRAVAWGSGVALLVGGVLYVVGGVFAGVLALVAGIIAAATIAWGTRWPREDWRVALWVEEQVAGLQFALVSATDPVCETRWPALERSLPIIPWRRVRHAAAWRALHVPLGVIAALLIAGVFLPASRVAGIVPAVARGAKAALPARGLGTVRVSVTEPRYAGGATRTLSDPGDVAGLVGSTVELDAAAGAAVTGLLGDVVLRLAERDGHWSSRFVMPDRPTIVRLVAAGGTRMLTLTPRPDSIPALVIRAPASDTTLVTPAGRIALAANGRDDIGIVLAGFEYIVSSGAGESFTFKSGMLGLTRLPRAHEVQLRATIDVTALGLKAGDVVHLRAVANDGLSPALPDSSERWRGTSETRVIRIARAGEYDSVAVEGAPPPEIEGALSQRMLLLLTEALEKRRARLRVDTLRSESARIARDQTKLRKRVGAIIFSRLGDGEEGAEPGENDERLAGKIDPAVLLAKADTATNASGNELEAAEGTDSPVIAVNKPLLEAYNYMWDAQRALEVATPGRAIAPMRRAIAALQKARAAERIYLRGRPPIVVVDVDRVRLTGKDQPKSPAVRTARSNAEGARRALAERLGSASLLLAQDPRAAIDSLLLVRVEALTVAPTAAAELGRATEILRRGGNATVALALARRLLLGSARVDALGGWTGGPW